MTVLINRHAVARPPNGWDQGSSQAAGRSQAQQGQSSVPQQPSESFSDWQNRQAAYDSSKKS
jgi:hypothetical protein